MSEPSDVEIAMHLFRLIRSGNYATAAKVLAAAREDFPEVSKERIKSLMSQLARRIVASDR